MSRRFSLTVFVYYCCPGVYFWGMDPMDVQGSSGGGGDTQGGCPRCGHPHGGHGQTRGPVVHLASRTQASGAVWTPRIRKDHDSVQCTQILAWYGGQFCIRDVCQETNTCKIVIKENGKLFSHRNDLSLVIRWSAWTSQVRQLQSCCWKRLISTVNTNVLQMELSYLQYKWTNGWCSSVMKSICQTWTITVSACHPSPD